MVAIQARRRNDVESIPTIFDASQPLGPFIYEPLDSDSDSDSFRLLMIEPSLKENDTLSCKLNGYTFKRNPSLCGWGRSTRDTRSIRYHLRDYDSVGRNARIAEYRVKDEDILIADNEEREMVKELCADRYWNRLWIIQEIGRARQIEVLFGEIDMSWKAFIKLVTLHNNSDEGAWRLNSLLREKYSGAHIFRKLLSDHREALCKEPRDKIYGLVGSAADTIGFPMDYDKSLVKVWVDTMKFMNRGGGLSKDDIISVGGLVKSLLIGANSGPLEQALPLNHSQSTLTLCIEDTKNSSPEVFGLKGYVVGCMVAVSPSPTEIVSNMQKADRWDSEILQNFPKELGEAHRENDELTHYILEAKNSELESIAFSHMSSVPWKNSCNYHRTPEFVDECKIKQLQAEYSVASQDISTTAPSSNLFLVKNYYRRETPWKMGIATSLARPGDLVCWISGVSRALLLRQIGKSGNAKVWQVLGTALFTRHLDLNDKTRHVTDLTSFDEETMELEMDASTIYVLLS
ncbi:putative het domain protein [Botrytis fragariae]|uniref:Putative het domain protein n=1 Tax=Botrytis fragariae TaxID=1964551 RepID=A0A8H6ALP4_9HELO|nr:putative het domain protein [Botrytis fragariae]KAF5869646.1 putative het domain protein [Botrytis fragariae]